MKRLFVFILTLFCIACTAYCETAPYFEEKAITVYELNDDYIPLDGGIVRYYEDIAGSEAVYDCGMKCAVVSDVCENGERIITVRLTLLVSDTDPNHVYRSLYAYPTAYDYYSGRNCSLRDSIGAKATMKPVFNGEEISVDGQVIDSDYLGLDNYTVYTVDYEFEMPEGYDGLVIGCFPVFEFENHDDFMEKKNTTYYKWPDQCSGGIFIRIR